MDQYFDSHDAEETLRYYQPFTAQVTGVINLSGDSLYTWQEQTVAFGSGGYFNSPYPRLGAGSGNGSFNNPALERNNRYIDPSVMPLQVQMQYRGDYLGGPSYVFDYFGGSGSIRSFMMGSGSVTSQAIGSGAVSSGAIASGSITSNLLGSGAIVSGQIGNNALNVISGTSASVLAGATLSVTGILTIPLTQPASPVSGNLYFTSSSDTLYIYDGVQFVAFTTFAYDTGYVYKLNLIFQNGSAVTLTKGNCRNSTDTTNITLSVDTSLSLSTFDNVGGVVRNQLTGTSSVTSTLTAVTGTSTHYFTDFGTRAVTGTISDGGGTTWTGTGTKFLSEVAVGDLGGSSSLGYVRITAIASDTSLTVANALGGTNTGVSVNCIEYPTIKIGSNNVAKVDYITSDTSLHITAGASGTQTNQTSYAGDIFSVAGGFYLFAYAVSGTSGAGGLLSTQRTTPWLPAGYTTAFRRVGVVNVYSGNVLGFTQEGAGEEKEYQYEIPSSANGNPVLSNGSSAGAWTSVACNALMPPTSTKGVFGVQMNAGSGVSRMDVRARGNGSATTTRPRSVATTAASINISVIPIETDGAQYVDFSSTDTGTAGSAFLQVCGFVDSLKA